MHSFIHVLNLVKPQVHARHCSCHWEPKTNQNPCSPGLAIPWRQHSRLMKSQAVSTAGKTPRGGEQQEPSTTK